MLMRDLGHQIDRRSDVRVILNIAAVTRGIRAGIASSELADHLGKRQSGHIAAYTGVRTRNVLHQRIELRCRRPNAKIAFIRDVIVHFVVGNAISAVRSTDTKQINLNIQPQDTYVSIVLSNNIKGNILADNPTLETTKPRKDGHGYGIKKCAKGCPEVSWPYPFLRRQWNVCKRYPAFNNPDVRVRGSQFFDRKLL